MSRKIRDILSNHSILTCFFAILTAFFTIPTRWEYRFHWWEDRFPGENWRKMIIHLENVPVVRPLEKSADHGSPALPGLR